MTPINQPAQHIKALPDFLINQIKAGEVVEKPAYMIKELIENSIDAKATQIELEIVNNGLELFAIKDNGLGIHPDDLEIAFKRHTTSKISHYQDLYKLYTYGFRGEALASISAMSKIQCYTVHQDDKSFIEIHENELIHKESTAADPKYDQPGTEFIVKNLFYNTPVRLKFLKSAQREKKSIVQVIESYLVCHPQIDFKIKWDHKEKLNYPAENKETRWSRVLLKDPNLDIPKFFIQKSYDTYSLEALFIEAGNNKIKQKQIIIINERPVEVKTIHYTLMRAIPKSLLKNDKLQSFILKLTVPPQHVDVNVNPNKTSIKIFEENKILSFIYSSIESYFNENYSAPEIEETVPEDFNFDFNQQLPDLNLDSKPLIKEEMILHSFLQGFLFSHHNIHKKIFYLNLDRFWKHHGPKVLQEMKDSSATPFLISKKFMSELTDEETSFFAEINFEVNETQESNGEKSFLLRSFPSSPKYFSPLPFFKFLLDNISSTVNGKADQINYDSLLTEFNMTEFWQAFKLEHLLQEKIVLEVQEEMFFNQNPTLLQ